MKLPAWTSESLAGTSAVTRVGRRQRDRHVLAAVGRDVQRRPVERATVPRTRSVLCADRGTPEHGQERRAYRQFHLRRSVNTSRRTRRCSRPPPIRLRMASTRGEARSTRMRIDGRAFRTIWLGQDGASVEVIDQRALPHRFAVRVLRQRRRGRRRHRRHDGARRAADRRRGRLRRGPGHGRRPVRRKPRAAYQRLLVARPTAVNLRWALDRMRARLAPLPPPNAATPPMRRRRGSPTRTSRPASASDSMAPR